MGTIEGAGILEKGAREDLCREATLHEAREQITKHVCRVGSAAGRTERAWTLGASRRRGGAQEATAGGRGRDLVPETSREAGDGTYFECGAGRLWRRVVAEGD